MQRGDREPRQLRGDAAAPAVGAVGGQQRDAGAGRKAELHEHLLDAADQVGRALIGERSARPGERRARRIARERAQRLRADGRKGIERIGHGFLRQICHWLCLGRLVVPMFGKR